MFSFAKKPAVQEVVLRDLTEDQLTQVAGGYDCNNDWKNDHDADDKKKKKHHKHHMHHHMHHHHHMMNDHDRDDM
jgi:hypothetical protein